MKGRLITVEGIDGTGKSTQAELLCAALRRMGVPCLHTREPGGTAVGARLRELLLHGGDVPLAPVTEMLLLAADRAQHVAEVIRPALERGEVVVCERYVDSSLAYQGASGVPLEAIRVVNEIATGGLRPDLTLLFDLDPEASLRKGTADRIEARTLAYHRKVREAFRRIREEEPERVVLVPVAGRSPSEIHRDVMSAVGRLLGQLKA